MLADEQQIDNTAIVVVEPCLCGALVYLGRSVVPIQFHPRIVNAQSRHVNTTSVHVSARSHLSRFRIVCFDSPPCIARKSLGRTSTSDTVSSQPLSDRVIETLIGVGAALVFTSFHVLRPVRQREL